MLRVRKLVLAMAAASALSSGMAHALGLGEVTLKSSLNQPLEAEIELVEARGLAPNEVLPSLASPEEFNKAGVERQFFLTDLKFTPVIKPNGKSVIRVTSSKSVREPYLNFLVEVLWPNGRLLREYTVLLDPPLYSPQAAAAPRAAVTAPIARPASRPAAQAPRPASNVATRTAVPSATGSNEYRTQKNDSLWEVAQRSRQNGSIQQAMLAIQDLNPDAFIDGNINRMKSGEVLRLPTQADINRRSQAEALAQVNQQNAAWREGRSAPAGARQLDATKRDVAGAAPAKAEEQDKLKLVSAESGKSTAGSDTGQADSKAISNKLAVTQESLDSTRRANEELSDRMADLQSQVDKLQRLIKLKDDQLAKLQADLASQGGAVAAPEAATPADTATAGTAAPADATQAEPSEPVADAPAAQAPGVTEEPDFNYSEEPATTAQAPALVETPAPATQPVPAETPAPAQPVAPAAQSAPASMVDDLLANPMLLGLVAAGGLLALLVVLMMISRRKAQKESEAANDDLEQDNSFAAESELPADDFAGLNDDFDLGNDQAEAASDQSTIPQTSDVLGEADIYIAYGRFNQAAELLQNAINDEPERSDLHLKLMEVYAEMGDREGYARQQDELREMGGAAQEVAQLNARYPAMAAGLAGGLASANSTDNELDSFSLDDLTMDDVDSTANPSESEVADSDDSFDLSLDDLESELDSQVDSTASNDLDSFNLDDELEQAANTPSAVQDDDLGFELSLDEEAEKQTGLEDELADFNFDLDSTPASDTPVNTPVDAGADDDFLLSLDDADLSPDTEPSAEVAPQAETDDGFDLSLSDDLADLASDEKPDNFAAQLDEVTAELDQLSESLGQQKTADELDFPEFNEASSVAAFEDEDDFDFLSGTDETATKLDLARAYIDMGDSEGARDILDEVVAEGNDDQQKEAKELIDKLV